MAAIDLRMSYGGDAPAITDLLGGQIEVFFSVMTSSIEHNKAGRLPRARCHHGDPLAGAPRNSNPGRVRPGYEVRGWNGIAVPKKMRAEIIEIVNKE